MAVVKSLLLFCFAVCALAYTPDWESIDSRPLPGWYDEAKFGIFIHWGVFSVPSFGDEWYWWALDGSKSPETVAFHDRTYGPNFKYADFAPRFTAEMWDPEDWADTFSRSGAKYIVLTTKHHEGFTLFPSSAAWNWNAVDTGPHQDLVANLSKAVRDKGLIFGAYHSLFEWFHPLYLADKANGFKTRDYVTEVLAPELATLINQYHPEVLWSDGDWEAPPEYWNSTGFLAWLYNDSPVKDTIVTNDRWGAGVPCKHGGYYTCQDRYTPGHLVNHKWEDCATIQTESWGFDRRPSDPFHSSLDLITTLVSTVAFGGNLLLNVGPTWDGLLPQVFKDRLLDIGAWLNVNGDAIYGTKPWEVAQNQTNISAFYTAKATTVYAILFNWPGNSQVQLIAPRATAQTTATMLGMKGALSFSASGAGLAVTLPPVTPSTVPCDHAWVLRLDGLANANHV